METDYRLQFRLIRETFNGFYTYYGHEPKIKRLAISSTYGFLTIADTEREFATALTDVFEQRQYCNPEEESLWHRGRETDYTTKISLVKLGFNCNGRVLAVDATTRKGSFIYLYDAAVLAPNLSFVAYAVNKIKLVGPMPKGLVEKKPLKSGTSSSESEYYERPELKTKITTVEWNPVNPHMLAAATDETLFIFLLLAVGYFIMITDYSLQFRLIQQHEREDKKYLNTSISSTYGSALVLTNSEETWRGEGQYYTYIRDVWTDFLERHEYVDFENFNYRSKNFIYNERDDKGKSFIINHNCDGRVVAVANSASKILFYGANLVAPYEECHHSVRPIHATKLSNSSAKIKMLEWNPMNPEMLVGALAKTLYTMLFNFEEQSSRILAKRDMYAPMTAVSWNPKGTQLIVGDAEGRIFQFNPQLKLILTVNPPDLIPSVFSDKCACSGLCWVSKTERIVVFSDKESNKLHLTKLIVKPNKPPKWTVWDILPAAESTENNKTFNFLPIFEWNTVLMSSPCLSEVYTFGIVNNVWQPLKLDERFTIKAPIQQILKPVEHKTKLRYDLFRNKGKPKNFEAILPTAADVH